MSDWHQAKIAPQASIREAIVSIDSSALQIALVVDEGDLLLGTITDGDIRRGILRGVDLGQPAAEIMQRRPKTIRPDLGRSEALRFMQENWIKQVPRVDGGGRVVGLETLDELLVPHSVDTWVVLMVGGRGQRLRPLTDDTPKPLLEVGDRPLLATIVESFVRQGFRRIFFSVRHLAEHFEEHFGDGARWGARISYLTEEEPLGTAGALGLLPEKPSAPVIVMNGDLLTTVDYRRLVEFHHGHDAEATMCVREYTFEVPYGVAVIERDRLVGLSEKPRHHFFVNAGIYVLSPEALELVPRGRRFDMPQLFEELIAGDRETAVFPIREYWLDIGRADDLDRARSEYPEVFG